MFDLKAIYLTALARCAPERIVREHVTADLPRNVVAIGKCAAALLDGVAGAMTIDHAFAAIPDGYPLPSARAEVHIGGHPHMTPASFDAGRALLRFVEAHDDILFLISGGGSACVEVALAPHTEEELIKTNAHLIASGKTIGEINAVRKELSAIKGGRLGERVRGRQVSLIYSDVSSDRPQDVASGPTNGGIVIADNTTLVLAAAAVSPGGAPPPPAAHAAEGRGAPLRLEAQIECDVQQAAEQLAAAARQLKSGQLLIAGGEPTVVIRGPGKGGRCSELALRFARELPGWNGTALFAASDGVDGNSGAAGIVLRKFPSHLEADAAFARSDTWPLAAQLGEPIMIAPTGNNLRDLFLVARG